MYKNYCDPEQLETLERIEKYSFEQTSELLNSQDILSMNYIDMSIQDKKYQLPNLDDISYSMNYRLETIKNNNYTLPTLQDRETLNTKDSLEDRKAIIPKKPFTFIK